MRFSKGEELFQVIGKKYTGKFKEYPIIIPKAIKDYKTHYAKELQMDNSIYAIVYEPWRGPDHIIGYFYLGLLTNEFVQEIPQNTELIKIQGEFASISTIFNVNQMGEFYDALESWIVERKDVIDYNHNLIEVYTPREDGQQQLDIYMKITSIKESEVK